MPRIVFLCLFVYSVQTEAIINADIPLEEGVGSRQNYEKVDIILTEDQPKHYILSPRFSSKPYYPPNTQIEYKVKIMLSKAYQQMPARIYMHFETFALEISQDCHKDGFEVMDNITRQLRVYCGSQTGRALVSEDNAASLRFFSDNSIEERGYRIRIEIFFSTCSQEFIGSNTGELISPNYPNNYTKDEVCLWRIEAPEGYCVRLKFDVSFIVLSPDKMCSQDRVEVSSEGDLQVGYERYCGTTAPGTIDSIANVMIVKFRSDCCFEGKGFRATFGIIKKSSPPTQPPVVVPEECKCGISFVSEGTRIIGGEEVNPPHRFPWMCGLVDNKNSIFCGCTLISGCDVLTAAHCVEDRPPSDVRVVVGAHNRTLTSESIIVAVEIIEIHNEYDGRTDQNDIAWIRLSKEVEMSEKVFPICLTVKGYKTDGTQGIVTGWGREVFGQIGSNVLRQVTIPVIPNPKCVEIYGSRVLNTNICAGEAGKDACGGDSGGPFFTQTSDDRWMLFGIVSWGIGCGTEPGVYVRVSEYLDWIYNRTGDLCKGDTEPPTVTPTTPPISPPPQPNIKDCGIPNPNENSRIVGGKETGLMKYPWVVCPAYNGRILGVGCLVNRRFVITAASTFSQWLIENPDLIDIFIGKYDLYENEPDTEAHKVTRIIIHPRYGEAVDFDYDFALVELYLDRDLPEKFRPICLPPYNMKIPDGTEHTVAGWGRISTNSRGSSKLMETNLFKVNSDTCSATYPGRVTRNMICAGNKDKDACYGDSGAPLMMLRDGRYFLSGVMSWGPDEGCAIPGKPSVFSWIQIIRSWLNAYVNLS